MSAALNWEIHQIDFETAFLNSSIKPGIEVYIMPPEGFSEDSGIVLLLNKAIYGLKQASRAWQIKIRQWLLSKDWKISQYDACIFYHVGKKIIISVYVDDVNIFGARDSPIAAFKAEVLSAFKITDAGIISYYLSMQIEHLKDSILVHQGTYVRQILKKYGF